MNPPDPIPVAVKMTEAEALRTLLAIAAMEDGIVTALTDFVSRSDASFIGYALLPHDWAPKATGARFAIGAQTWCWVKSTQTLEWRGPAGLGGYVTPTGRIDRGLGAVHK